MIKAPNTRVGALGATLALSLVLTAATTAQAAVLFTEDFQGHADGSIVTSANGWTGTVVNVNDSGNFGGSRVLDGIDYAGTVDGFAYIERSFGGLASGAIHEMTIDAFAQSTSLQSHNNGMGLGSSASGSGDRAGAYWSPLYDVNNVAGQTGWVFAANGIAGGTGNTEIVIGGFDAVRSLKIVVDGIAGEVYGVYDFGSGSTETAHFAVGAAEIAAIDEVFGFFDFRSANLGSPWASTSKGTRFGAAQWDNIQVTGAFAAGEVP
ncbi:MAG: hypothetical protein QF491_23890, partial [Alphaproteobacteria bacterium]|nr:hypothetical protein [Alphaproteobacteria bacterium]